MLSLTLLVLDVALTIGGLLVLLRTVRLVRQHQGLGAAVLLCLVLLACGGHSSGEGPPPPAPTRRVYEAAATVTKTFQTVDIDRQPTYTIQLFLLKGQARGDTATSVQVRPVLQGFYSGSRRWLGGDYALANHQLHYHVYTQVTWKLLGFNIYTQLQEYQGVAAVS